MTGRNGLFAEQFRETVTSRFRNTGPLEQQEAAMAQHTVSEEDVADLIRHTAEAASVLIRGDVRRYLALVAPADDFTLMNPFGGYPSRGFDASPEYVETMERLFAGVGEAELEVVATYASADLVVLVAIERQHGEISGLPEQDWSLRVTLVFRRDESGWRLAHRHADPLVHPISLEQLSALARG